MGGGGSGGTQFKIIECWGQKWREVGLILTCFVQITRSRAYSDLFCSNNEK